MLTAHLMCTAVLEALLEHHGALGSRLAGLGVLKGLSNL